MSRDKLISAKAMKEENLNQRVERSDKASIPNHLVSDCQDTFNMCLSILEAKNADYANGSDPLKNFNASEIVGVDRERAILVRIMDKISRVSNLLDRDPLVKDESLEDTINDAINYLAILKFVRKQIK